MKKALDGQKTFNNYETMIRKGAKDHRGSQAFSKAGRTGQSEGTHKIVMSTSTPCF